MRRLLMIYILIAPVSHLSRWACIAPSLSVPTVRPVDRGTPSWVAKLPGHV